MYSPREPMPFSYPHDVTVGGYHLALIMIVWRVLVITAIGAPADSSGLGCDLPSSRCRLARRHR